MHSSAAVAVRDPQPNKPFVYWGNRHQDEDMSWMAPELLYSNGGWK